MKIYYLDDSSNVYDEMGQVVGKLGVNNLFVNEENKLIYNNQIVGSIGGKLSDITNNNSKSNVRTLKKDNNSGFGQVVILGLILLCLGMFIAIIALSLFS